MGGVGGVAPIAHQALRQAIAPRGSLPETASIALAALSNVHFEHYQLEQADKYLSRAVEVDPNPTSTNMAVSIAILRCKIQLVNGQDEDALATVQSIRELHARRPSGMWTDLDLTAYEAMVCVRTGNLPRPEQLMHNIDDHSQRPFLDLVRAEVFLIREQDVLHLLGEGRSNSEIATQLCISESTVKTTWEIFTKNWR
jgi:ATP/maltotriose-dependent transcriptional regulator MalT